MAQHTKTESPAELNGGPDWAYWDRPDADNLDTMRAWRIGEAQLAALRESAKIYEGETLYRYFLPQ